MNKKYQILLLLVVLGSIMMVLIPKKTAINTLTTTVIQRKQTHEIPASVRSYLDLMEQYLDSMHTVGAALTIVKDRHVLVLNTYGVKKIGTSDSINKHTVFRLASCSKGFAGVLACLLEQDSIFSLNDKVVSFLPEFTLKDTANTNQLSILHTLSHTSGLVPHAFDNLIEDGVPLPLIIQQLSLVDISATPGILYGYQNVIFSLIDTIARAITHTSYEQLLDRRIFRPLHMRDASASRHIFLKKNGNFAYPHVKYPTAGFYPLTVNLGYYNIAPAAGVNASISDMSKWLLALLGNNPEVLDSALQNKIADPVIVSPLKRRYTRYWGKLDSKHYGLGWRIYEYRGRRIVYHGGYVRGYRAEVAFCPEENVGICFLQNSPNFIASLSIPTFFEMHFNELDSINSDSLRVNSFEGFEWFEDSSENL